MPSRRLGRSLGIDLTPHKVCTFNCVYCQCGATTLRTTIRKPYIPPRTILKQVLTKIRKHRDIDFLTFSGSGEPTLNSAIGELITGLKKKSDIPICVITNGSTLGQPQVRNDLRHADLVMPTLCAASQRTFRRINQPHPALSVNKIIQGLVDFRREFKGRIWLEIMLVRGYNDSPRVIRCLQKAIARIRPDRIYLNTVIRPPRDPAARPLSRSELKKIQRALGPNCAIAADFTSAVRPKPLIGLKKEILEILKRRPETPAAIAKALTANQTSVHQALADLQKTKIIKRIPFHHRIYYRRR